MKLLGKGILYEKKKQASFLIAIINRSVAQRMAQIYYDKNMTIE